MSFVKTPEETARIKQIFSQHRYLGETLVVEFETTAEFIEAILPPGFEPLGEPMGVVQIGRWQMAHATEFDSAGIYFPAKHKDQEGLYTLAMFLNGDMLIYLGREMLGEIKKTGKVGLHKDGDRYFGYCDRDGVRLIEVDAVCEQDVGPAEEAGQTLEVKAVLSADGQGLEFPPKVICYEFASDFSNVRVGTASLKLRSSVNDPLAEIPVLKVLSAAVCEGEMLNRCQSDKTREMDCEPDALLPYVFGKMYDNMLEMSVPARYR